MMSCFAACRRELSVLLAFGIFTAAAQAQQSAEQLEFFKGHALIAACDTDMLPSAYLGGTLGPDAGLDQLAVIRLDRPPGRLRAVTLPVTNSVAGPPASVAVTPDGRYAIVIETRGPRSPTATHFADLPQGRTITVVDLVDLEHPRVVQKIQGREHPLSVSINHDGTLIAIPYATISTSRTPPVALYRFAGGQLSEPVFPTLPGFAQEQALTSAQFHPTQDVLALVYEKPAKLGLVKVNQNAGGPELTAWGGEVSLDPSPFTAIFTPDGKFVLINSMLPFVRGTVTSIRVGAAESPTETADSKLHNFVVSHILAGTFPEGLAVSPDAHWVVTSNLENSTWPLADPRQGFYSSLTLLRLDPVTGYLTRVGDYPFDGMLPEAPVFDDSSRFIAVTNFSQFRNPSGGGSIDFWRIAADAFDPSHFELVKMLEAVPVPRGPQSMAIVRSKPAATK